MKTKNVINLILLAGSLSFGSSALAQNQCRYANDGVCDEPTYCAFGTDTNDCRPQEKKVESCKYNGDGVCDEPTYCAKGTDYLDCRYGDDDGGPFNPPPQEPPAPTTKTIYQVFAYDAPISCLENIRQGVTGYNEIVGYKLLKNLKGATRSCDNNRELARQRRGRHAPDGEISGHRRPNRRDFSSVDCSYSYINEDSQCVADLIAKARPGSWNKKGRTTPKPGQRRAIEKVCSTEKLVCSREVDLSHPARGVVNY